MNAMTLMAVALAGWMNRQQQEVIEYLREEVRGAMANPGHELGRGTIAEILKQAGLEPAPERERAGSWAEFLRTHWEVLGAADFFTVELWKWGGLMRYHVLFVLRLSSRTVQIAGIVPEPDGEWMKQVGRNLTDCVDGFLCGCRYLIHDRSTLFTKEFLSILEDDDSSFWTVRDSRFLLNPIDQPSPPSSW